MWPADRSSAAAARVIVVGMSNLAPGTPAAAPVQPRERILALDALRGFALCGIIFINIPQALGMVETMAQLPEGLRWFVHGRFYPIFFTLFGVGFGIFLRSAARRTTRPRLLLVRRFGVLAVFGALHHLLQPGEVLLPFAITGLLVLLPLSYLPPRAVLAAAGILTAAGLLAGVGGLGLLPGLFAIGFAFADLGVPQTLGRRTRQLAVIAAACAAISVLGLVLILTLDLPVAAQLRLGLLVPTATGITYATLFLLLLSTRAGPAVSGVFAPLGRMALTNYLTATVLFVSIGEVLGLRGSERWTAVVLLGAGILVVQAAWSPLWLRAFRYGPLEWVWRCATYWQTVPLRNRNRNRTEGAPARKDPVPPRQHAR